MIVWYTALTLYFFLLCAATLAFALGHIAGALRIRRVCPLCQAMGLSVCLSDCLHDISINIFTVILVAIFADFPHFACVSVCV